MPKFIISPFTGKFDATEDLSGYLKLDQTTPQTLVGTFTFPAIIVTGEMGGCRQTLVSGHAASITASQYLRGINGVLMTSAIGHNTWRAGSITGIGLSFNVASVSANGNIDASVKLDGISKLTISTGTISTTGVKRYHVTQARGIDTFTADQNISMYFGFAGAPGDVFGGSVTNVVMDVEVVFDD